jgi:hypothetical protein
LKRILRPLHKMHRGDLLRLMPGHAVIRLAGFVVQNVSERIKTYQKVSGGWGESHPR